MMEIKHLKPSELKPYDRNNRKHPKEQIDKLVKQIEAHGFDVPIVVDANLVIIKGHARLAAAKKLKLKTVPVIVRADLTEEQCKAARLADNKLGELAEIDMESIQAELDALKEIGFDLDLTAFSSWNPFREEPAVEGLTDPDDAPEVNEKEPAKSKRGDTWILGNHRLRCGDSTDAGDVALLMNGEKAALLLTDPPYGVSYADKNAFLNEISPANRIQEKIENDHMTADQMNSFWNTVLTIAHDSCNDRASYYIFSPQGGDLMMMMSIKHAKWQLKHMLVWVKNNHVLGRCDYNYKHEPVFFGWKEDGVHDFYGDGSCISVLNFNKPLKNDLHPTMKPVELCKHLMGNSTKSGDLVLEMFGGSGSTLIAAEELGRRCFAMELDKHYCDVIIKRWQQFTGKKAVREDGIAFDDIG